MKKIIIILIILISFCVGAFAQEKVELKFADAPLLEVITTLADRAGVNLTINGSAQDVSYKRITFYLKNVTYLEALYSVLHSYGIKYKIQDRAIMISLLPSDLSASAFEKIVTCLELKNISAARAKAAIESVYPDIKVEKGVRSSSLIVYADEMQQQKALEFIRSIDQPLKKILIEAKVIETSETNLEKIGTSINNDQSGLKFNIDKDSGKIEPSDDFVLYVNGLVSKGKAEVLAQPRVAVLDGEEANINIGSKIPYAVPTSSSSSTVLWSVQYIDAGVSLKITPRELGNKMIEINLEPEVSAVTEWRTTTAGEFPVISTRNVATQVAVEDGQTLVIAGLVSRNDYQNNSSIPLLGDIPVLGRLFQYSDTDKSKTEIIFLITPKIV